MFFFFFFNDTATTEIYTLSLHDALPIFRPVLKMGTPLLKQVALPVTRFDADLAALVTDMDDTMRALRDRKSTRLNSSHGYISYAVFCLKKKKLTTILAPSATTRGS